MIVDTSEVKEFAAKLQAAPERKRRRVSMIVKKAAQNVKNETRADLTSSGNAAFRHIPISYEVQDRGSVVEADVAPDDGGAGNLANLAFFGTAKGGGTHDFYQHARAEFPNIVRELRRAAMGL